MHRVSASSFTQPPNPCHPSAGCVMSFQSRPSKQHKVIPLCHPSAGCVMSSQRRPSKQHEVIPLCHPSAGCVMSSQRRLGSRSLRNQTLCPVTNCHLSFPKYALSKNWIPACAGMTYYDIIVDNVCSLRWNDKVGHHRYWCLHPALE